MKFGFVKFSACILTAMFLVMGLLASDGISQDLGTFSGQGIQPSLQHQFQQAQQALPANPNINNFLNDEVPPSAVRNPFSGLFKKPKLPGWGGLKQTGEFSDPSKALAEAIAKQQSSKQNFFKRLNLKSKDFFEKTKGWAKGKGAAKPKSNETWNNVIRDFKVNQAKLREEQGTIPVQPNFRAAEAIGEPKLRF